MKKVNYQKQRANENEEVLKALNVKRVMGKFGYDRTRRAMTAFMNKENEAKKLEIKIRYAEERLEELKAKK